MDVLTLGDVELRRKHVAELQSASDPRCHRAATNEHALLKGVRDEMRRAVVSTFHGRVEMLLDAYIPFNVPSTVERFRTEMGCQGYEPSDVETVELHYAVVEACNQLEEEVPCLFSRVHLLSELSTARIKHKWRASPECIRRVIDECVRLHRAARIQPGDAVGIMTATSVGEPTTQMTLNTFHFAGVDNVGMTQGVPRMREIIGATKNMSTPLITLPMRKDLPNPKVAAELLARSLPHTVLRNVVKDARLVFEPLVVQTHVASDVGLVHEHLPFLEHVQEQASRWVIRIELDRDRASARTLEPRLVADLIQEELMDNALVVSSTVDDPSWVVRVYLVGIEAMVDAQFKKSRESGTTRAAARRSTQRPSLAAGARKRKQHMDMTSISDQGAHVSVPLHCIDPHVGHRAHSARAVVEWMVADNVKEVLRELSVGGLKGVSAAVVRLRTHTVFDSGGAPRDVVEPVVDVLGTGLAEAALLPAVDQSRVVSSDVIAVYETYGITAAAHVLYNELCTCLASSGARVDERLIKMVVDVATHDGYVMPISRHGLNRLARHGVLAKITFEETLRILFTSAVFGSYDPLLGVSENTIVGKPARLGTNLSQMYYEQDGELLECGADATASSMPTATLDTRVLKSVMSSLPESCVDLDEENDYEADMNAVYRDESLERILAVRRTRVDQITAATTDFAPSAVAHPDIYSFKLFQTNAKRASSSNDGPFRPSSPVLDVGAFEPTEYVASEPFRPSSPAI